MKKMSQVIIGGILFICLGFNRVSADTAPSLELQKEWEIKQVWEYEARHLTGDFERSAVPGNRTVTLPTDNDNDGMADDWETANGLDPSDPSDAWLDPDGDKVCNLFEYQLGYIPNSPGQPPVKTVASSGADYTTIEDALDNVADGTVVRVAAGTYPCNYLTFNERTVMLQGGWNSSFTERDLSLYPTILDGEKKDEILYFSFSSESPVIILDGLNFINGAGHFGAVNLLASGTAIMKTSVLDCTFNQSTTSSHGGILSLHNWQSSEADRTIANTLIVSNIGSGIYAQVTGGTYARWRMLNCTITDNLSGGTNGAGIDAFTLDTGVLEVEIYNTIIWDNAGPELDIRRNITVDVDYSVIGEINVQYGAVYKDHGHTIYADPRFISNLNFRLLGNSPCIDTGINDIGPFTDLDGRARPASGTGLVDIGCYEYYALPAPPPPWITDYNGDGTSDLAIFRGSSGLWAVKGITRAYFGGSSDIPVPGDYTGDGTTNIAIFRESSGLWAVSGGARTYFGGSGDLPVPGDYSGNGTADVGICRSTSGLWAIRGVTRAYFGSSSDEPVPGYYGSDVKKSIGIFRPASGLWALKGITRAYFGSSSDTPVPGDYAGSGSWGLAIYRPASGLWAIKGVTRAYFGGSTDSPIPGGYKGDGKDYSGIFRGTSGLWAIRGVTRAYFGSGSDVPVTR